MKREVQARIDRAVDGRLSPEEWGAFQKDVIRDADLRAAYVRAVWLHQSLRNSRAEIASLQGSPSSGGDSTLGTRFLWPALAAACALLALGVWLFPINAPHPAVFATIIQADNCKWAGSELPTALNSRIGAGTINLVEGMATLAFESGAKVTLEAPSKLQITDAMHCRLLEGAVTAEVPESAHGFTVDAPDLKVVDLGTRFGLTAAALGASQVRVFEGEVEVHGAADGRLRRLTQGNGMQVHAENPLAGQEPVRGSQIQESGGWVSIPTSFGRGKDAYTRRSDADAPLGRQPILIVKHTDIKEGRANERRAVISFDLSQTIAAEVQEAELVLEQVSSGFGFSALVPDSRFAVYGITDENLDQWDEHALRWKETPACSDQGPDLSKARRLAEFWIPRGGSGVVSVRSAEIARFLREDTNGLVSFLLVRETGESEPYGLAHGFGAKEHPTALPPTLRLKTTPR